MGLGKGQLVQGSGYPQSVEGTVLGTRELTVTPWQEAGLLLSVGAGAKRGRQCWWGWQCWNGRVRGGGLGAEAVPVASGRATGG